MKEYATEESLTAWGHDGIYLHPQHARNDGWADELLTRDVTEWRKAEGAGE